VQILQDVRSRNKSLHINLGTLSSIISSCSLLLMAVYSFSNFFMRLALYFMVNACAIKPSASALAREGNSFWKN